MSLNPKKHYIPTCLTLSSSFIYASQGHTHHHHHHHHQSVLPKDRYFTATSGTKVEVLLKGRSSTANSGTQAAPLLGMDRYASFPLLFAPTLSLASEETFKDLKRSLGHQRGGEESVFDYLGPPDFTEIHPRD